MVRVDIEQVKNFIVSRAAQSINSIKLENQTLTNSGDNLTFNFENTPVTFATNFKEDNNLIQFGDYSSLDDTSVTFLSEKLGTITADYTYTNGNADAIRIWQTSQFEIRPSRPYVTFNMPNPFVETFNEFTENIVYENQGIDVKKTMSDEHEFVCSFQTYCISKSQSLEIQQKLLNYFSKLGSLELARENLTVVDITTSDVSSLEIDHSEYREVIDITFRTQAVLDEILPTIETAQAVRN